MSRKPRTPCVAHAQNRRYGVTRRAGRLVTMHVAVWEAEHGPKPEGWHVDHLCFNPRCIRLDHLEAVPAIENVRRQRNVKLSLAKVREIRAEYAALPRAKRRERAQRKTTRPVKVATGARAALAARHGLTPDYLKHIVTGRVWPE